MLLLLRLLLRLLLLRLYVLASLVAYCWYSSFYTCLCQCAPKQVRPWQHKLSMFLWLDKWPITFISHLTKCLEWKLCEPSIGAGAGKHWPRMWFIRCLNGLNGSECGTWHSAPARYQHSTRNHLYIYFYCTDTSPRISAFASDIERKTGLSKNYLVPSLYIM